MTNHNSNTFSYNSIIEVDNKIFRKVDDIILTEKILNILKERQFLDNCIVDTNIFSKNDKLIEHKYIKGIIHSEEYTESMAYDIAKYSLDIALELLDNGIYSWDLLPHNFTFSQGKWLLYDFDSIGFDKRKIKTIIRGYFKIIFSSFEIIKLIPRKNLEHLYLNRVKCSELVKIIPFKDWLKYFIKLNFCMFLFEFRQYKKVYKYLKKLCKYYEKGFVRQLYKMDVSSDEKQVFILLDDILKDNEIDSAIFVGEISAKYAFITNDNMIKTIYVDDYDIADRMYNSIVSDNKKISIGVLYPLENSESISANLKYRAIYDNYAKKRFRNDCVIFLENETADFINNLSDFADKLFIIKISVENKEQIICILSKIYNEINVFEVNNEIIITAKNKKLLFKYVETEKSYKNFNRGYEAEIQTCLIKKYIKLYQKLDRCNKIK